MKCRVQVEFCLEIKGQGLESVKALIKDNWNLGNGRDRLWDSKTDINHPIRYSEMACRVKVLK